MRHSAAALLLTVVTPLAAQDVIHWADGTTQDRCQVTDFNVLEIKWKASGREDKKSSDLVVDLVSDKVKDTYKRGYAAKEGNGSDTADMFLGEARQHLTKTPFLAQFGFWEAAKFLHDVGKEGEAFPILDELIQKMPDSAFVPRAWVLKLDYYLATGKAKDAGIVAKLYKDTASTKGYPNGYVQEAQYYTILAQAAGGAIKPNEMRSQLEALASQTDGQYPRLALRCRLQVAHSLRQENKAEEALAIYQRITQAKAVDKTTLAGAMLGIGHLHFAKGNEVDKEPYREALLAFLHVYIDTQTASPDVVAEALYHGAEAARKWGGNDHGLIAGRLRHMLRTDSRFSGTEWAAK